MTLICEDVYFSEKKKVCHLVPRTIFQKMGVHSNDEKALFSPKNMGFENSNAAEDLQILDLFKFFVFLSSPKNLMC